MEVDFYNWMFVFLRTSAFLLVLPFFTMANFPVTMRVALSALWVSDRCAGLARRLVTTR